MALPESSTFGELVRHHRLKVGFTQEALAGWAGISRDTVRSIESGRRVAPHVHTVKVLSDALSLSHDEFEEVLAAVRAARAHKVSTDASEGASVGVWTDGKTVAVPPGPDEGWAGVLDVRHFVGREGTLRDLQSWILDDRCQVVTVVGMGGVGKSALAAELMQRLEDRFDFVLWWPLGSASSLEETLQGCVQSLADRRVQASSLGRKQSEVPSLLSILRTYRCLIVFDDVDSILHSNRRVSRYRDGYKEFGALLRYIGETRHKSCLLVTGREQPGEVASSERHASSVRALMLPGLDAGDARMMLREEGLFGSEAAWDRMVHHYAGNPLALKFVAESVRELFKGNIDSFLQQERLVFGGVQELIAEQFDRLVPPEQAIMCLIASNREAVRLDALRKALASYAWGDDLLPSLHSLRRRSMIEVVGDSLFAVQPMIEEYVLAHLVECIHEEIDLSNLDAETGHKLSRALSESAFGDGRMWSILELVAGKKLARTHGSKTRPKGWSAGIAECELQRIGRCEYRPCT